MPDNRAMNCGHLGIFKLHLIPFPKAIYSSEEYSLSCAVPALPLTYGNIPEHSNPLASVKAS